METSEVMNEPPPFLRLPAELRDAIFSHVFEDANHKLYARPRAVATALGVTTQERSAVSTIAPLLVCHTLYSSALDALYESTTFELLTTPCRPNPYICDHSTSLLPNLHNFTNVILHVDNVPHWSEHCRRCYRGSYDEIAAEMLCQVPNASQLSRITVSFNRNDKAMWRHGKGMLDALRLLAGHAAVNTIWQPGIVEQNNASTVWLPVIVDQSKDGLRSPACMQCERLRPAWACLRTAHT